MAHIREKCGKSDVAVDISTAAMDMLSAVRNILRQNTRIDMVLLSPSITCNGAVDSKTLSRLVKTASRPVVTMAKQATVA